MKALMIMGVLFLVFGICLVIFGHVHIMESLGIIGGVMVGASIGNFALASVCRQNPAILTEIEKLDRR